ncbi:histidine kinase [Nonomuraea lactucae]|uniref:sensor histidine kinase n=1 Tax=Nonomuraea lactucae TaxID=2249762 RepID=UPI000DE34779
MVRRLLSWWSGHPRVADALLAATACGYLLITVPYHDQSITEPGHIAVTFWGDLLVYASLAWRRRHPLPVLALVWTLWLIGGRWDIWAEWNASWSELSTPTALMLMFYTMGRWTTSRWTGLFLGGTLLPVALGAAQVWAGQHVVPFPVPVPADDLFTMSFVSCMAAWGLGRLRHSEAEALAEAVTRAEESQVQAILDEERVRIARELHDIVAHNVSAIVIQAHGAAAALVDEDVAAADAAIEAIAESGRTALVELRLLLGVLRQAPAEPQPDIRAIHDLVRRLPLEVRLLVEGQAHEVSSVLSLSAYRIVQEALTNTLKHAGKEANAEVLLRYADDGLHIRVTDNGAGRSRQEPGGMRPVGAGHGLTGIQERAAMLGGTARAVPLPDGGFQVEATLPWA